MDFWPLLRLDFFIGPLCSGGNPTLAYASDASFPTESFQADAIAPTVPKFPPLRTPGQHLLYIIPILPAAWGGSRSWARSARNRAGGPIAACSEQMLPGCISFTAGIFGLSAAVKVGFLDLNRCAAVEIQP
ncbi:hypothetical protein [Paenibacillus auburnensis]|uniref:hypothetical protein n=1 Tax=Paenibacillus auburnensis TaxID=2905649 RepID=UPI001F297131|nr:hypothetical protein [Paenibacillus auburnensis]